MCFSAAFSCLTCSKEPNNISAVDVVCGQLPAAILLHLPVVLPQGTTWATLLGMALEANVALKHSFWFPGQLCAGVATGMDWCAVAHPKFILSLQQAMSWSWNAWCITVHLKHYGWRFCLGSCGAQLNATKDVSVFLLHAKKRVL